MSDISEIFGDDFNHNEYEPTTDFTVIPPGKYKVQIVEASVNQTKAGNGHYIKLQMKVIEGERKGAVLFDNLNIDNPSTQAVEIAKRTLSAVCKALQIERCKDTAQLQDGILNAHVKVKDDQNRIRTYSAAGDTTVAVSTQQPRNEEEPNEGSQEEKLPWQR